PQRHMMGSQLSCEMIELRQPRPSRQVGGERCECLAPQDVLDKCRQVAPWPNFHEEADSVGVHILDQPRELDRCRPVGNGEFADLSWIFWKWPGGGAGVSRDACTAEGDTIEESVEVPEERLEHRGVVRPAQRQPFAEDAASLKLGLDSGHG